MKEIRITLAAGEQVDATVGKHLLSTEQGETAPAPLDLFLVSIGNCSALYIGRFCRQRDIPTDGLELIQRVDIDAKTHLISRIELEVRLPEGFPDKYRAAVIRAAGQCTVKKNLERPPSIEVVLSNPEPRA